LEIEHPYMKSSLNTGRALGFTALAVVSVAIGWHPLSMTLALALTKEAYTHILLVIPLSAGLIYVGAKYGDGKALSSEEKPDYWSGAVVLGVALRAGG
jgi:hypothetical protein